LDIQKQTSLKAKKRDRKVSKKKNENRLNMNSRNKFAVAGLALMYLISWTMSLSHLFGVHFWDREANLERYENEGGEMEVVDGVVGNSTGLAEIGHSYFTARRYMYFLPHVLGAILWWNLYFLQLIPSIRHAYEKKLHRILGRLLMVTALAQTLSGVCLAYTARSQTIRTTIYTLAMAVVFCVVQAWFYAYHRDIPKHKMWALRLVGYMQTIALERFFLLCIILHHTIWEAGSDDLLSQAQANQKVWEMFDQSFILALLTALLLTEWYLAGEQGYLDPPTRTTTTPVNNYLPTDHLTDRNKTVPEQQPLLQTTRLEQ